MGCLKCKSKEFTSIATFGALCIRCFSAIVERRVRREIRKSPFLKDSKVLIVGEGLKASTAKFLIGKVTNGLPLKIETSKEMPKNTKKYRQIISCDSQDGIAEGFLSAILVNSSLKKPKKNVIMLLQQLSDGEIAMYAKANRIKGCPKSKKSEIRQILSRLEQRYPGIKASVVRSREDF